MTESGDAARGSGPPLDGYQVDLLAYGCIERMIEYLAEMGCDEAGVRHVVAHVVTFPEDQVLEIVETYELD